jgi:hypothetical protein
MNRLVQEFAQKFYDALDAADWGDIDPELFNEIATTDDEANLSIDARELMDAIAEAL